MCVRALYCRLAISLGMHVWIIRVERWRDSMWGDGEKRMKREIAAACCWGPIVIIFDECTQILSSTATSGSGRSGPNLEGMLSQSFMEELSAVRQASKGAFWILITNTPADIPPPILSRFGKVIDFAKIVYTDEEYWAIAAGILLRYGERLDPVRHKDTLHDIIFLLRELNVRDHRQLEYAARDVYAAVRAELAARIKPVRAEYEAARDALESAPEDTPALTAAFDTALQAYILATKQMKQLEAIGLIHDPHLNVCERIVNTLRGQLERLATAATTSQMQVGGRVHAADSESATQATHMDIDSGSGSGQQQQHQKQQQPAVQHPPSSQSKGVRASSTAGVAAELRMDLHQASQAATSRVVSSILAGSQQEWARRKHASDARQHRELEERKVEDQSSTTAVTRTVQGARDLQLQQQQQQQEEELEDSEYVHYGSSTMTATIRKVQTLEERIQDNMNRETFRGQDTLLLTDAQLLAQCGNDRQTATAHYRAALTDVMEQEDVINQELVDDFRELLQLQFYRHNRQVITNINDLRTARGNGIAFELVLLCASANNFVTQRVFIRRLEALIRALQLNDTWKSPQTGLNGIGLLTTMPEAWFSDRHLERQQQRGINLKLLLRLLTQRRVLGGGGSALALELAYTELQHSDTVRRLERITQWTLPAIAVSSEYTRWSSAQWRLMRSHLPHTTHQYMIWPTIGDAQSALDEYLLQLAPDRVDQRRQAAKTADLQEAALEEEELSGESDTEGGAIVSHRARQLTATGSGTGIGTATASRQRDSTVADARQSDRVGILLADLQDRDAATRPSRPVVHLDDFLRISMPGFTLVNNITDAYPTVLRAFLDSVNGETRMWAIESWCRTCPAAIKRLVWQALMSGRMDIVRATLHLLNNLPEWSPAMDPFLMQRRQLGSVDESEVGAADQLHSVSFSHRMIEDALLQSQNGQPLFIAAVESGLHDATVLSQTMQLFGEYVSASLPGIVDEHYACGAALWWASPHSRVITGVEDAAMMTFFLRHRIPVARVREPSFDLERYPTCHGRTPVLCYASSGRVGGASDLMTRVPSTIKEQDQFKVGTAAFDALFGYFHPPEVEGVRNVDIHPLQSGEEKKDESSRSVTVDISTQLALSHSGRRGRRSQEDSASSSDSARDDHSPLPEETRRFQARKLWKEKYSLPRSTLVRNTTRTQRARTQQATQGQSLTSRTRSRADRV